MVNRIKSFLKNRIKEAIKEVQDASSVSKHFYEISNAKSNTGKILSKINFINNKEQILRDIQKAEFQVYSQWGDDGIIDFLVNYLDFENKTFVEFGVENYTECNTRFLLVNNNWSGLIMDGSEAHMTNIKNDEIYWKYDLKAMAAFITAENINSLLSKNGYDGALGLLHIDIDGNDYWVWKAITVANPVIVIVEYNSVFGNTKPWAIPYDASFVRTNAHYSNLYFGVSLVSLCDLAEEKGYYFVGCNSNGNNAYFVRKDKIKDLSIKNPKDNFVFSKFVESRDKRGELTYVRGEARLNVLKGLPIVDTRTNKVEII